MRTVSGTFCRSFDEDQNRGFWTFLPTELNLLDIRIDQNITDFLVQAHRALGILEGMTKYIPNVEHFLEMMICGDAYHSCRIDNITVHYSGNGRVGRLLPALLLMKQRILSKGFCLFQNIFISIMMCVWICISEYSILEIIQNG